MRADFDAVSKDVVSLDHRSGIDDNLNKGSVVLRDVNILQAVPGHVVKPSRAEKMTPVSNLEASATGEAHIDNSGRVDSMNLHGEGGTELLAAHSNGFLGAGKDRLVLTERKPDADGTEVATYFADGSLAYTVNYPTPDSCY